MPTQAIALGGIVAIALAGAGVYIAQNRIEVCHATGSENNPWAIITVSERSWPSHQEHGDKYPVPPEGCDADNQPGPPTPGGGF